MREDTFAQQIGALQQWIDELQQHAAEPTPASPALLEETLAQLQTALEELLVAEEELHEQNAMLLATQQELEQERQRFAELFEGAPDGYLTTDAYGIIQRVNRAAGELFQLPAQRLVRRPLVMFVAREQRSGLWALLDRLRTASEVQQWQGQLQPRPELRRDIDVRVAPVRGERGELRALRWIMRDVTARTQAEEQLQRANEALERRVAERTAELLAANEQKDLLLQREQAALAESEARYRAIAGLTSDFAYAVDVTADGEVRPAWLAGAFTAITGYEPHEILRPTPPLSLIHADDIPIAQQHKARLVAGRDDTVELRVLTKCGQVRWIRNHAHAEVDAASGRVVRIVGAVSDITARKAAETALRESEERFRLALDGSPVVVFSQDRELRYTWIFNSHPDLPASVVLGKNDAELLPEAAAQLRAIKQRVLETGVGAREQVLLHVGDKAVWYDLRCAPLRNPAGEIAGITCAATDVNDLKQVQADLLAWQRRVENVLESISDAYYLIDRTWRCVYMNRAAEQLLRIGREQLLGRDLREVFADPDAARFMRQYQRAMDERVVVEFEDVYPPLGVCAEVRVLPIEGDGIAIYQRDITARKRAEQARISLLERLVTAQEDERRRLSHELHDELGRYLTAVQLGLSSLHELAPADAAFTTRVRALHELTATLGRSLHALARQLRPAALDDLGLVAALENYVEEWSRQYSIAADVQCLGSSATRLPPTLETTIYRIVQEALTNVARHAQASRASVILERRNRHLQLIVEDNGQGFDAEALLEAPDATRGLGLIGIQERVALLGGTLAIESFPGGGATLFVRMPVPQQTEAAADE